MDATKILPDEIFDRISSELEDGAVTTTPEIAERFIKRCMYHDVVENVDQYKDDKESLYNEINEYIGDLSSVMSAKFINSKEVKLEYNEMAGNGLVVWGVYNDNK